MTVSVRRDPAVGAIVLQKMLFFLPSIASVLDSPNKPNLAANMSGYASMSEHTSSHTTQYMKAL
jgi:hypothetical protein